MGLVIHQNRMTGRKKTKTTNIQQKHLQILVPSNYKPKIKGLFLIVHFALKNEILVKIDFSPNVSKFIEMEDATLHVRNPSIPFFSVGAPARTFGKRIRLRRLNTSIASPDWDGRGTVRGLQLDRFAAGSNSLSPFSKGPSGRTSSK